MVEFVKFVKKRIHSDMKISDKIKLDLNIMPFAFFFSTSVPIPSDININSRDLHYCFRGPAFSLPGPALLLPDLHYFTVTFPSRKIKQTEVNEPNRHSH